MSLKWLTFIIVLFVFIFLLARIYYDTNTFKINKIEFHSDKISKGSEITILQISDVHNKAFRDHNEKLLHTVEELHADIIVITGDLIDRRTAKFENVYYLIDQLTAINENVYFVSGNHEWENVNTHEFFDGLQKRNVTILDNGNKQLTLNHAVFNLVGVADFSTNHENVDQAFLTTNNELYTIMLSHSPDIIKQFEMIQADLILSGHTHGGQVRLPFIGAVVAPDQGLFPKLDKGIYRLKENQHLYIDSGLGTSVIPIRFLNQSQISLITIVNNS
ncbi:metallophosphoesterase [Calidifontibacillus oryziterrae]|uniref:metallophosphoesterase n=1 Tax=Calidifontibacillus oryziterrae TaxID=1191699 RepID=UPI0002EB1BD6|nr:metallophosphoesterase [Calidifontibacillus oryziterrae]